MRGFRHRSPRQTQFLMIQYYRTDSRKLTFKEYWNMARSWKVLIPWFCKVFGIRFPLGGGLPRLASQRDIEITETLLPLGAREKLQPWVDQFSQLGFHSPRYFHLQNTREEVESTFIALFHSSGEAVVRIFYTLAKQVQPPLETVTVAILSGLEDGTVCVTSNQREMMKSLPGTKVARRLDAEPAELWAAHEALLAKERRRSPARRWQRHEDTDEFIDSHENESWEFNIKRGVYVLMSDQDLEQDRKHAQACTSLETSGSPNAGVLAELSAQTDKKGGWGNAVFILALSLILFIAAGASQWNWKFVLMLVPILLIHEMGHYLAMRAFNYRNLRMFFIPLFGAAVTGRHYNVPGWKKCIVSLMGPVPGILLASVLGSAGLLLRQDWLIHFAVLTLIVNGFNLLPVLPLDGGWVAHAVLFSRHRYLDAGFRIFAIAGLVALGIFGKATILAYLAIPMALTIPLAWKLAKITHNLRVRGVSPASEDDQTIPAPTAEIIIEEVKRAFPKMQTNKTLAQYTSSIFESLNARPPGWAGSLAVLSTHLLSAVMALVFTIVFVTGQRGGMHGFLHLGDRGPKTELSSESLAKVKTGARADFSERLPTTIVATFARTGAAEAAWEDVARGLPENAAVRLFGNSVLLALPPDEENSRNHWVGELQKDAQDVFVASKNFYGSVTLSWVAPNEQTAEALEDELNGVLQAQDRFVLIPPWFPNDARTEQEQARQSRARRTFQRLENAASGFHGSPTTEALLKKMSRASRQADQAALKQLQAEYKQAQADFARQNVEKIRAEGEGKIDVRVVDLHAQLPEESMNERTNLVHQQLGELLGCLPVDENGLPLRAKDKSFLTLAAYVSRDKLRLSFGYLAFYDLYHGAPALITWLHSQGCREFRYQFSHASFEEGAD